MSFKEKNSFRYRLLQLALTEDDFCCTKVSDKDYAEIELIRLFKEEHGIPQELMISESKVYKDEFGNNLWGASLSLENIGKARNVHNDYFKTKRKVRIAKRNGWNVDEPNRFNKGKIHCSCDMCSSKYNDPRKQDIIAKDIEKDFKIEFEYEKE